MSFMAKFLVQGRDAGAVLNRLVTADVDGEAGIITYTQVPSPHGTEPIPSPPPLTFHTLPHPSPPFPPSLVSNPPTGALPRWHPRSRPDDASDDASDDIPHQVLSPFGTQEADLMTPLMKSLIRCSPPLAP